MEDSWKHDPKDRPVVEEIVTRLNPAVREDNRPAGSQGMNVARSYFRDAVREVQDYPSMNDIEAIFSQFT